MSITDQTSYLQSSRDPDVLFDRVYADFDTRLVRARQRHAVLVWELVDRTGWNYVDTRVEPCAALGMRD